MKRRGRRLLLGLLAAAGLLVAGEWACRTFRPDVQVRFTEKELFRDHAFGESRGLAPNASAMSFGVRVYTDSNGFRVPAGYVEPEDAPGMFVVVGDSVVFGVGVKEEQTFVGRLRREYPDTRWVNAGISKAGLDDYLNLVRHYVLEQPGVSRVYLVYALNDIFIPMLMPSENQEDGPRREVRAQRFLQALDSVFGFHRALTARSHLYILLKSALQGDVSLKRWRSTQRLYTPEGPVLSAAFSRLREIAAVLREAGVPLTVIIAPFEAQVRPDSPPEFLRPQELLMEFFRAEGIDALDALPAFRQQAVPSSRLYLFADHAHFSALGHEVMFEAIREDLKAKHP